MKLLLSSLPTAILHEAEMVINDRFKIHVSDEADIDGMTRVYYGEPADLFSFGQTVGIIRTANKLLEEM